MQEKIYGDFTKASATVLESLKELGEINTRFVDKLAKQQIEVLNKYVAEGLRRSRRCPRPRATRIC